MSGDHLVMPEDHMEELYSSKNKLVKFVHLNRLKSIIKSIPSSLKIKRILDAGCGEGHLLERLFNKQLSEEYHGLDITPIALDHAKIRCPFAEIQQGDLVKIPYSDHFFDAVICTEVLEHIHNFQEVLIELKRVIRPGGLLILTFPNEFLWTVSRFFLRRKPIKVPDHVNSFYPSRIKKLVLMRVHACYGLPFKHPFFMSLGYLIVFRKE